MANNQSEITKQFAIADSEDPNLDFDDKGFFIQRGKYFTLIPTKKGKLEKLEISNFAMRILYNMRNGSNNSSRVIFLQRYTGEKMFLEVKSSETKPETFETILKSNGCTFLGNPYQLKKIFAHLMDHERTAIMIITLGWNHEHRIYSFADSIFTHDHKLLTADQMGIINHGEKCFYLPAYGIANASNEDYLTDRLFKFRPGTISFTEWAKLLFESSGDNAIIGVLYVVLAVFRDLIFHQLGFFPFMYLFGEKGTGKSQFVQRLLSLFGSDTTGTPLNNATIVALNRLVSSRINGLFYFKEYTTETDSLAEDFILSGYDGAGRETGVKSNDTKTKKFPISSGIIFDGNTLPRKSNILSRMVLLSFDKTKFTADEKKAFSKLRELSKAGFGRVLLDILQLREEFEANLKEKFEDAETTIRRLIDSEEFSALANADERVLQQTALLYTAYKIAGRKLGFPFTADKARRAIFNSGNYLNNLLHQTNSTTVFWEAFAYNQKRGNLTEYTEGVRNATYRIKPEPDLILQLKLRDFYPHYVRYCKDNGIRFLDSNSLRLILTSPDNPTFIPSQQKGRNKAYTDKYFGSCHQFQAEKSETNGYLKIDDVEIQL